MRITILLIALSVTVTDVHAQYAQTQDSSLIGLKRVYLNFGTSEGALDQATAEQIQSSIALELRKAGLRIVRDPAELDMNQDGLLNVSIVKIPRSMTNDMMFRIDLEQNAQLARTKKPLQMVTWFYEDNGRNVIVTDFARAAVTKGVNEFLNKWLDANGR